MKSATKPHEDQQKLWIYNKLLVAAHTLKRELHYHGSKQTTDFAMKAQENLLRRAPDVMNRPAEDVGGLLWRTVANTIRDQIRADCAAKQPPRALAIDVEEAMLTSDPDPEASLMAKLLLERVEKELDALAEGEGQGP